MEMDPDVPQAWVQGAAIPTFVTLTIFPVSTTAVANMLIICKLIQRRKTKARLDEFQLLLVLLRLIGPAVECVSLGHTNVSDN